MQFTWCKDAFIYKTKMSLRKAMQLVIGADITEPHESSFVPMHRCGLHCGQCLDVSESRILCENNLYDQGSSLHHNVSYIIEVSEGMACLLSESFMLQATSSLGPNALCSNDQD